MRGLGRVDGYVLDRVNHDLILIGPERRTGEPVQKVDDLAIALRAAALRYAETKGNVRYITAPGVTLNPRPANIAALQRIAATAGNDEKWVDGYCAECQKAQDLLVFGIPFDSSSAEIMSTADYKLKKIANSDLPVTVAGFESLAAMRRRQAERDLDQGTTTSTSSMSRLWFYPGQLKYREEPNAIALERADVLVRQKRQVTGADGSYRDGGPADPLTVSWTCSATRHYREIANAVPESGFDALARLLRIYAVAKLMIARDAGRESGTNLAYLLDRHAITPVHVDHEWPGVAHKDRIERSGASGTRRWRTIVNLPMCGGVEFDFNNKETLTSIRDPGQTLLALADRVVRSRPDASSAAWRIR
jgi:hypothetical protein